MRYLTLEEIKRQLNIDEYFDDEDMYLEALGTTAEQIVESQLNCKLTNLSEDDEEPVPEAIKSAMKLVVEHLYNNRGSETNDLPPAFYYICKLYHHFD